MNHQEIKKIVTEIVSRKLKISETEISPDSILKDLGADSLDELEIILELEQKLKIMLPDEFTLELQTIGSVCKFIEKEFEL
ncbi:MAG: phosphopantetheine-binding protein [Draconibacterium sp.]|nr:phosphopantetheine-binding protein [Draconibacterium sp.]